MAEPETTGQEQGAGDVEAERDPTGRYLPGRSGNPAGRPRGARNRATLAAAALLEGEGEELTRKAVELAKGGDVGALRLCLERLLPRRQDAPVRLVDVEEIRTADVTTVAAAALEAVAVGQISPREGLAVVRLCKLCGFSPETPAERAARELAKVLTTALEHGVGGEVARVIREKAGPEVAEGVAAIFRAALSGADGGARERLAEVEGARDRLAEHLDRRGRARELGDGGNGRPANGSGRALNLPESV